MQLAADYSYAKGKRMVAKPQRAKRKGGSGRPRKYTIEFLRTVPKQIAQGKTLKQIADETNGKVSTIVELCRQHKIVLPSAKRLRTFVQLRFSTVNKMEDVARELGITYNALAERLLDVIAQDALYKAVLDD